jgi:hypothetical protein
MIYSVNEIYKLLGFSRLLRSDPDRHLAVSPRTAASMGRAARTEALEHYSAENYTDSLQRSPTVRVE